MDSGVSHTHTFYSQISLARWMAVHLTAREAVLESALELGRARRVGVRSERNDEPVKAGVVRSSSGRFERDFQTGPLL